MRCKFCPSESVRLYAEHRGVDCGYKFYKCPDCGSTFQVTWTRGEE